MQGREITGEFVAFQVDGRSYALPLDQVVEVVRMVAVAPLPDAPAWVAGVVNLRGELILMIDLRQRFGGPPTDPDPSHVFLVARARGRTAGVLADWVQEVAQVSSAAIDQPPGDGEAGGIVSGLARSTTGVVVILDLGRLLDGADVGDWWQQVEPDMDDRIEGRDDFRTLGTGV